MDLLSDTEARENLAEKIVSAELAGNAGERDVRKAQLLGKQFPATLLACCRVQMRAGALQSAQMALACEKYRFAGRGPARCLQDRFAQPIQACAGLRRDGNRPRRGDEARDKVDFVVNIDPRNFRAELLR